MPLFGRKSHHVEVHDNGDGNFNFACTCGAYSRSVPSRQDAETKARLHKENTGRR